MPRDIPIGNGRLLVTFDRLYRIRDVYFPHVGQENHTDGNPCQFGVWSQALDNPADTRFAWVTDDGWQRDLRYRNSTLVTHVELCHPKLELSLVCSDAVDIHSDVFIRQVVVTNQSPADRHVRLFMHFDAQLWGNHTGDAAFFDPAYRALVHYKGKRYVWLSGTTHSRVGLASYAIGNKRVGGQQGTWRDAEDGVLGENAVAQGSIDSVGSLELTIPAGDSAEAWLWLATGARFADVRALHEEVLARGPQQAIERVGRFWSFWVHDLLPRLDDLPPQVAERYTQSLLVLRTQIDDGGAIVAANDSDIIQFGRDTYSYMWPRDGALVAIALDHAGYHALSQRFFRFASELLTSDGCFLHNYNPDGSAGSSWHPWVTSDGERQLPIQEDETALVLHALDVHVRATHDMELVRQLYDDFILPATRFLLSYRDRVSGLPMPSYDLWEERRGVMSFTVAAVWAGLQAGARFADLLADGELAVNCRHAASEMRDAMLALLWDPSLGRFLRRVVVAEDGSVVERDTVLDASLSGIFQFGMLRATDPRIVATMETIERELWVRTPIGGIARYTDDYYHQVSRETETVPGNPWIICTLWLAEWYIAKASSPNDIERALDLIEWAAARSLPSGVLPEQVHPYTGEPLSVSPLTWSHAQFVQTVRLYLAKVEQFDRAGWETFLTV